MQSHNVSHLHQNHLEITLTRRNYSCYCGHDFCYICGLRWYTCTCEENPLDLMDVQQAILDDAVLQGLLQIPNNIPVLDMIAQINALVLVHENEDQVDADPPVAPPNGNRNAVTRAAPVRVAEPQLGHRDRNHEGWRFVHGAGDCEHCGGDMPVFPMECRTCQMRACRRCALNRL